MRFARAAEAGLGNEEALIGDFVLHGRQLDEWIEPAEFLARDSHGESNLFLHVYERCGEDTLGGALSDAQ